ncbi:MAG: GNAT family N-acetyltransferase, partial [Alphaproteobacteria bacterium]|nr:GNAT family N-acetyltransferase [Alphaproteobacteria bacterium]
GDVPVGMCSLKKEASIRPDLIYSALSTEAVEKIGWLSSLVVDTKYQKQGIAKMLINATVRCAKDLGLETLYLFAVDPTIPNYYMRLGWKKIGMDELKSRPVTLMSREL